MRGALLAGLAALLAWFLYEEWSGDSVTKSNGSSSLFDVASAIYAFEDPNKNGIATKNNNPGNLKFAGQPGATEGAGGFAVFTDLDAGFTALENQLKLNASRGLTLLQNQERWLGQPGNPNATKEGDPLAYATFIANKLGVSINDTLNSIFGG